MNKKDLLTLAETYSTYDKELFKTRERFAELAGYKFVENIDGIHLCFSNKWTLPDFLLEPGKEATVLKWLTDAEIPESKVPVSKFLDVLQRADKHEASKKAVDFKTVVSSGCEGIKMPGGVLFNVVGILPSLPFLDDLIYWEKVNDIHYTICVYGKDFKLHICPLLPKDEKEWRISEVHDKKEEEKTTGFGLFF